MYDEQMTPSIGSSPSGNPVSILAIISFGTGLGAYLLCGFFIIYSMFFSSTYSNAYAQAQNLSTFSVILFFLSGVFSLVGLVTGIVGVSIRRGERLEGRGFAVAGMVLGGSYLLIMLVLLVIAMFMVANLGALIGSLA